MSEALLSIQEIRDLHDNLNRLLHAISNTIQDNRRVALLANEKKILKKNLETGINYLSYLNSLNNKKIIIENNSTLQENIDKIESFVYYLKNI